MNASKSTLITLAILMVVTLFSSTAFGAEKRTIDPRRVLPLFRRHCAVCHGMDGKGQTDGGIKSGVKDYTDKKVAAKLKDLKKVEKSVLEGMKDKKGKVLMFPFKRKLKTGESIALIKHLAQFSKPKKK